MKSGVRLGGTVLLMQRRNLLFSSNLVRHLTSNCICISSSSSSSSYKWKLISATRFFASSSGSFSSWNSYNNSSDSNSNSSSSSSGGGRNSLLKFKKRPSSLVEYDGDEVEDEDDTFAAEIEQEQKISALSYKRGQEVDLTITKLNELGAFVSINDGECEGMIFRKNIELYSSSHILSKGYGVGIGRKMKGFISRVQVDGKVDVSLFPIGKEKALENKKKVVSFLRKIPGHILPLGDRSLPTDIEILMCGMSKADFKLAISSLFKEGLVVLHKQFTVLAVPFDKVPKYYLNSVDTSDVLSNKLVSIENSAIIDIFNVAASVKESDIIKLVQEVCGPDYSRAKPILKTISAITSSSSSSKSKTMRLEVADVNLVMHLVNKLTGRDFHGRVLQVSIVDIYQKKLIELFDMLREQGIELDNLESLKQSLNKLKVKKEATKAQTGTNLNSNTPRVVSGARINNVYHNNNQAPAAEGNRNISKSLIASNSSKRDPRETISNSNPQSGMDGVISSELEYRVFSEDRVLELVNDSNAGSAMTSPRINKAGRQRQKQPNADEGEVNKFGGGFIN